jgi:hypothetical protein
MSGCSKEKDWVGIRSKREEARDHAALRWTKCTMIGMDAEQLKHGESNGMVVSHRRRGTGERDGPGSWRVCLPLPLHPLSPSPLARARVSRIGDTLDHGGRIIPWPC